MSEAKPFKPRVETYTFDGKVVTMTSLPPDKKSWGGPCQRSKWKIEIDGELRGYAFFPQGYGGKWKVYSLMAKDYHSDPDRATLPWDFDEAGYDQGYEGLMGVLKPVLAVSTFGDMDFPDRPHPLSWTPIRNSDGEIAKGFRNEWKGRKEIACGIVHVGFADLPTKEVVLAEYDAQRERNAERKRKEDERSAQWALEREERAAQAVIAAEAAEKARKETLEGLQDIQSTHGASLSNFELAALATAIKHYGGE